MTLKEFREQTKDLDENVQLFMAKRVTRFHFGLVNSIELKEIDIYTSDEESEPETTETVLIIDEQ